MIIETVKMDHGFQQLDLHSLQCTDDEYFILVSIVVGLRSTCLRRRYGIIFVKNNEIISFGYNGNYDNKHRDCIAAGTCLRDENRIADNEIFEPCLREELGLELSDEDLNGVDVYISCYDKIQQKFMQTDIDEACLQCLSTAGVHRVIFAV